MPYVSKVVLGNGETLIDLTGDTVTEADVAEGKTFHLASGVQATGTASGGSAAAPDNAAIEKTVTFSTVSSGSATLVSAAELLAAGILDSVSESIFDRWTHVDCVITSTSTSPTTKMLCHGTLSEQFYYNNGTKYYRSARYHNTSATR